MALTIALIIGLLVFIIICIVTFFLIRKHFNDGLEENIDNEIKLFLDQKKDSDYKFKNKDLEQELRNQLKAAMIDWRSNGYRYKKTYIHKTTNKQKEIYSIINKYYIMDKKEHL